MSEGEEGKEEEEEEEEDGKEAQLENSPSFAVALNALLLKF